MVIVTGWGADAGMAVAGGATPLPLPHPHSPPCGNSPRVVGNCGSVQCSGWKAAPCAEARMRRGDTGHGSVERRSRGHEVGRSAGASDGAWSRRGDGDGALSGDRARDAAARTSAWVVPGR
eukprot:scaffold137954_cov31-Tisochrysis_lutea.AAC.4